MLKFLLGWGGGGGGGARSIPSVVCFLSCVLRPELHISRCEERGAAIYICKMICISKCHEGQYSVRQDAVYLRHTSKRDAVYLLCNLRCSDTGQSKVRWHMACEIIMIT